MLIVEEAHAYRNNNNAFKALVATSNRSDFALLLTATPIVTRPTVSRLISDSLSLPLNILSQDLVNLASIMKLPEAENSESLLVEIRKELGKAAKLDKNRRADAAKAGVNTAALAKGNDSTPPSEFRQACINWIHHIQGWYKGRCIRRTHKSLDNRGKPIFELEEYAEHVLMLTLTDYEQSVIESYAETVLENSATKDWTQVRQSLMCMRRTERYQRRWALCVLSATSGHHTAWTPACVSAGRSVRAVR